MGLALQKSIDMRALQCGECGVDFYAPEFMMAEKQRAGGDWYCPNGHCRVYTETTEKKLRKELEEKQKELIEERSARWNEAAIRQKAERELKRVKKRVGAGVCPECNRTFQQLARHMACKHAK
jgi:uncharacterized protein (UPF0212 family)